MLLLVAKFAAVNFRCLPWIKIREINIQMWKTKTYHFTRSSLPSNVDVGVIRQEAGLSHTLKI